MAEQMNIMLFKRAWCMLSNARLPNQLWVEAVNTTYYLLNRSLSIAINCNTLEHIRSSSIVNYSILYIVRYLAYARVNEWKLEPRANKFILLGYQDGVKGYKIWYPKEFEPMINRDVNFYETTILNPRPQKGYDNQVEVHDTCKKV